MMEVSSLERQIRRGLLGLLKVFRRNNITIRGFLKLYKEIFTTRGGYVSVKNIVTNDVPVHDPVPGSAEFSKLNISEQIRITDARNAAAKKAKQVASTKRLQGLKSAYGT